MNREIKFRAEVNGSLVYSDSYIDLAHYFDATKNYPQHRFTGLTDKNGVEIYEGDVLRTRYGAMFSWNNLVDYHLWNIHNSNAFSEVEIIGNLFQNPELLNK